MMETFIEILAIIGAYIFLRYLVNVYRDIRDGINRAAKDK